MAVLTPADTLTNLADLDSSTVHPHIKKSRAAVRQVVAWIRDYLCKPHPELGRDGPVCPFVPASISKRLLFLAQIVRNFPFFLPHVSPD